MTEQNNPSKGQLVKPSRNRTAFFWPDPELNTVTKAIDIFEIASVGYSSSLHTVVRLTSGEDVTVLRWTGADDDFDGALNQAERFVADMEAQRRKYNDWADSPHDHYDD